MVEAAPSILVKNALILTQDKEKTVIEGGDLLVVDGKIAGIGPTGTVEGSDKAEKVIDGSRRLVMPGLINAHSHSQSALTKLAESRDHTNVITALWYGFAHGLNRDNRDIYISAMLTGIQTLRTGSTSIIDQFWFGGGPPTDAINSAAQAYADLGMRANICHDFVDRKYSSMLPSHLGDVPELATKVATNFDSPPIETQISSYKEISSSWRQRGDRIKITPGAGTASRCTDDTLLTLLELAEEGDTVVNMHLLEHLKERESALKLWGKDELRHLDEIGFLSPRTLFGHAIWSTYEEVDLMAERGVSVTHNPELNMRLGGGLAPIRYMLDAGLNVGLGTDSSTDQSIFGSMRLASVIHRIGNPNPQSWVYADETLEMATNGGAKALALGDRIGSLEVGKQADFICLDLHSPWLVPMTDIVTRLAYFESGRGVDIAVVDGRVIIEDGRITTIDEDAIIEEAIERGEALHARNHDLYEMAGQMKKLLDPEVLAIASSHEFKR